MYKTLVIVFSLILGTLLVYWSFFTGSGQSLSANSSSLPGTRTTLSVSEYATSSGSDRKVFHSSFSSLAGAFFWTPNNSKELGFSLSGSTLQYLQGSTLFFLYDPFTLYTIQGQGFRIEQITNGSIYVGKEEDGTYSVYSVDAVARFRFLVGGEEMTNIILFPGYYLRFDPEKNADLKDADLLRVMVLIEKPDNTGLRFLNPRSTKTSTPFASYVNGSGPLLKALQYYLKSHEGDRTRLEEKYNNTQIIRQEPKGILFINEEKQNYFSRLHLKNDLASIIDPKANVDTAIKEIRDIFQKSKDRGTNDEIKQILREFITDARFVIYGGADILERGVDASVSYEKSFQRYEKMYTEVALLLNITPNTPQTKIFQRLSDVYLDNMLNLAPIDSYYRVSQVLDNTLVYQGGLSSKDYLDVALYTQNILMDSFERYKKGEESGASAKDVNLITLPSTYSLISTLFSATKKYYDDKDQAERRDVALTAFASQFYVPIMRNLYEGVDRTFMTKSDGKYLLSSSYVKPDGSANIDINIMKGLAGALGSIGEGVKAFSLVKDRSNERENLVSNYSELVKYQGKIKRIYDIMLDYRAYLRNPDRIEELVDDIPPDEAEVTDTGSTMPTTLGGSDLPPETPENPVPVNPPDPPLTPVNPPSPPPAIVDFIMTPAVVDPPSGNGVVDYVP